MAKPNSFNDYRVNAKRRITEPIFHCVGGAADGEWSARNNAESFNRYCLYPSHLDDPSQIDAAMRLPESDLEASVLLLPKGLIRLLCHDKELAGSRAANKLGIGYSTSTLSKTIIEDSVCHPTGLNTLDCARIPAN